MRVDVAEDRDEVRNAGWGACRSAVGEVDRVAVVDHLADRDQVEAVAVTMMSASVLAGSSWIRFR